MCVIGACRSSYDPDVRMLASPGYVGPVCSRRHRMRPRQYKRDGRHCDRCEVDIKAGDSGQCCKVIISINHHLCNNSWQVCDYDLCKACCDSHNPPHVIVASPAVVATAPVRTSPFRGTLRALAAPLSAFREDAIDISSSDEFSAPILKIHPFFQRDFHVPTPAPTHEVLFHAVVAANQNGLHNTTPHPRPGIQSGRLRRRLSTPVGNLLGPLGSPPPLRKKYQSSNTVIEALKALHMVSPLRVAQRLFPDSPLLSPSALTCPLPQANSAAVNIDSHLGDDALVTVGILRAELRSFLVEIGLVYMQ
jgi:hypothetical protein